MQDIVFGPIISRRFGISLGIDLSPGGKQCNFDCLYCELIGKKAQMQMQEVLDLDKLIESVRYGLLKYPNIDVLTITANGEPTLYPYLYEFMIAIKPFIPKGVCTLILSNGSLFGKENIQKALLLFDIVKFSLDSANEDSFKRIDRPYKNILLSELLEGIRSFSSIYKGELVAEVLLVGGINDRSQDIRSIVDFLKSIHVDRIDLGSVDRPPAYNIEALSFEQLAQIAKEFEGMYVSLPSRKENSFSMNLHYSRENLIDFIARRPVSLHESKNIFDEATLDLINKLCAQNKLFIRKVANLEFYTTKN
ncbi:radical SAM protein [Helicobacter sp. 11S03491-1]|uniref:radical SAM protein n=1 Tax=Helicobacter sp. 11S03491-1 TaxID=1476196 RepID=UPI000BA66A2F|nr:radical SAM protein [Helicobacter sp. 11S03491-1]PAF42597.1 hypothetical protein BKH45_03525 [Helicobacter sp. 11S03491-1]